MTDPQSRAYYQAVRKKRRLPENLPKTVTFFIFAFFKNRGKTIYPFLVKITIIHFNCGGIHAY